MVDEEGDLSIENQSERNHCQSKTINVGLMLQLRNGLSFDSQ